MNLKPIRTKREYKNVLKLVDELWEAKPNTLDGDNLEIITTLIEQYENLHYPILPPDPIEAIKFRMEQLGLSKKELAVHLGGSIRVSEILNRKRSLTVSMIRKLIKELKIPAESLIG